MGPWAKRSGPGTAGIVRWFLTADLRLEHSRRETGESGGPDRRAGPGTLSRHPGAGDGRLVEAGGLTTTWGRIAHRGPACLGTRRSSAMSRETPPAGIHSLDALPSTPPGRFPGGSGPERAMDFGPRLMLPTQAMPHQNLDFVIRRRCETRFRALRVLPIGLRSACPAGDGVDWFFPFPFPAVRPRSVLRPQAYHLERAGCRPGLRALGALRPGLPGPGSSPPLAGLKVRGVGRIKRQDPGRGDV